jgi:PAS domain S-box-containing protein
MEAEVELAADEIKRLKTCINNLISVQALPAIWSGGQPTEIVRALLDMLSEMLSLDFAYAQLMDSNGGAPLELARLVQDRNLATLPQRIGRALNSWLNDFPHTSALRVRNPIGDGEVSVLVLRLGLQAEMGVFVAGSKRTDFPTQTERLLLNVAANQAAIGLQEARLLGEQKLVAEELDQSIAQRTSQLLAANEELEKEIAERKRAEEKLRGSEAFLSEGQRISHTGSWSWDVLSGKLAWSQEHFRIFGFDPEKTEPSFQLFLETVHPDDRSLVERSLDRAVRDRSGFDLEFRIALRDGSVRHVQGVGRPVVTQSGDIDNYIGTTVDITPRKRAEALLAGEKRLLEMVARGDSLPFILDALCRLVEELSSGALSSILLFDPNNNQLSHGAAPSLPKAYVDAIDGLTIGPSAGSCGTAAYRAKPVIVPDIAQDPLWINYRHLALTHGLRSCWSSPILSSEDKVLGTFAIYHREPRSPTPPQHEIIDQITHLASIALERKQAEGALRASEQVARGQVEALAQNLDILATTPAPESLIGQMLSTIGRFMNAQSVVLWLLDDTTGSLVLRAAAEGENFAAIDPEHPFLKDPWSWKTAPWLREIFFTGVPTVVEDLDNDPRVSSETRDYFRSKGTRKLLEIPTLVGGDVKGFIGIRHGDRPAYRPEEIELAQALAHQAMFAIQFNQFAEQGQQAAVLEERNRMARDIHDTLAQGFTGVIVQLEAAEDAIAEGQQKEADKHLHRAAGLARESLSEARRSVHALRPDALRRADLWEALKGIIKRTTAGTPLHATFERRGKLPELPPIWQENLLHIGLEALSNTLKYARARNFRTSLRCNASGVRLELKDDGAGFELRHQTDGMGLTGMHERVEQMKGELEITSARGKGTNVIVALPLSRELIL